MHELSIAQSIVDIVQQYLPEPPAAPVRAVRMKIGALAGVVPDSLTFCFAALTAGTPLQGATLELEHIPLSAHCNGCGKNPEIEPTLFTCPHCGGNNLTILSGRELQLTEIELDDDGRPP